MQKNILPVRPSEVKSTSEGDCVDSSSSTNNGQSENCSGIKTASSVRRNAAWQIPIDLAWIVFLLGGSQSVVIFLEEKAVGSDAKNETWWDYLFKGFTLGLGMATIECVKDFTALKKVDDLVQHCMELLTGKKTMSFREKVVAIVSEAITSLTNQYGKLEDKINDLKNKYQNDLIELEQKHETEINSLREQIKMFLTEHKVGVLTSNASILENESENTQETVIGIEDIEEEIFYEALMYQPSDKSENESQNNQQTVINIEDIKEEIFVNNLS